MVSLPVFVAAAAFVQIDAVVLRQEAGDRELRVRSHVASMLGWGPFVPVTAMSIVSVVETPDRRVELMTETEWYEAMERNAFDTPIVRSRFQVQFTPTVRVGWYAGEVGLERLSVVEHSTDGSFASAEAIRVVAEDHIAPLLAMHGASAAFQEAVSAEPIRLTEFDETNRTAELTHRRTLPLRAVRTGAVAMGWLLVLAFVATVPARLRRRWSARRARRRAADGRCVRCGYPWAGLGDGPCPECGARPRGDTDDDGAAD